MTNPAQTIDVVDSHTGGEPTRVVLAGGPSLRARTPADAVRELGKHHDDFRRTVIHEPRGHDVLVGALLLPPADPGNAAGVVFFNNVGYIGMCGHGSIGVAVTLLREGRIGTGRHRLETPAGVVTLTVHDAHRVSVQNVHSYRLHRDVFVDVDGAGRVRGDVAWGGNWFFLVKEHGLEIAPANVGTLHDFASRVRRALDASDVRGRDGALVDHVELSGPPADPAIADGRNFVLCPGNAWDRSPCGTGTSAKLACLLDDGDIRPGATWRQQGISGSVFEARASMDGERLVPVITGSAWITGRTTLVVERGDPLSTGMGDAGA